MAATVECHTGSFGLTATATLFADGSDTAAASGVAATEATNRKGCYTFSNSSLNGIYRVNLIASGQTNPFWFGWAALSTGGTLLCDNDRDIVINGFQLGAVWVDTNSATAGNGTSKAPANTLTNALTIAAAVGLKTLKFISGSSITLASSLANYHVIGDNVAIALGGQDLSNAVLEKCGTLTGIGTVSSGILVLDTMPVGSVTLPGCVIRNSGFTGTFTGSAAGGQYLFQGCNAQGSTAPTFTFAAAAGSTKVDCRAYCGGASWTFNTFVTAANIECLDAGSQAVTPGGAASINLEGRIRAITINLTVADNGNTINIHGTIGTITISGTATACTINVYGTCFAVPASGTGYTVNNRTTTITTTTNLTNAPSSSGSGSVAVTITVTDGTNPIQSATVNLIVNSSHYFAQTDASGVAVLTPTEGNSTYTVQITASAYQFTPTTLVVSGATSHSYTMTLITFTPSTGGGVTMYGYTTDTTGNTVEGSVTVNYVMTSLISGDTGVIVDPQVQTAASDNTGLVQFVNTRIGAMYSIWTNRSPNPVRQSFTAVTGGGSIGSVIG